MEEEGKYCKVEKEVEDGKMKEDPTSDLNHEKRSRSMFIRMSLY